MAGYLGSYYPATQVQVPDIGPGVNYLASIPDQIRQDRMENEKMNLLKQATQRQEQEHGVAMLERAGPLAFKLGTLAVDQDKWDRMRGEFQKYGLPDPGDFSTRDEFLAEGAQLYGEAPKYEFKEIDTPEGGKQPMWVSPPTARSPTGQMLPAGPVIPSKEEAERKAKAPQERVKAEGTIQSLSKVATTAKELMEHPGLEAATGALQGAKWMPTFGQQAANFDAKVVQLRGQVLLGALAKLKELSATGSTGFGNLTEREGAKIESSVAALEQSQDKTSYRAALGSVIDQYNDSMKTIANAYQAEFGEPLPYTPIEKPKEAGQTETGTFKWSWN